MGKCNNPKRDFVKAKCMLYNDKYKYAYILTLLPTNIFYSISKTFSSIYMTSPCEWPLDICALRYTNTLIKLECNVKQEQAFLRQHMILTTN